MIRQLSDRFRDSLAALCPDWPERRFLVAFSGGLDSTALLRLAALFVPNRQLAAAHLNHRLRGQAAEADQLLAETTAAGLGLTCLSDSRDVTALAKNRRKGTEEAARQARYDFLAQAAEIWGADYILTAHQADDQAETMLMNFIKGAGAGGLAGIPRRRSTEAGTIILRPLLPFSRAELQTWLTDNGYSWAEDLSNEDVRYRRNAVRSEIIPRLKELNPCLIEALGRTSGILRDEESFWRKHLEKLWSEAAAEPADNGGPIIFKRTVLAALTVAEQRRLIYEALLIIWRRRPLSPEPLTFAGVETVLGMLRLPRHAGLDLPGGLRAEVGPETLIIATASRLKTPT